MRKKADQAIDKYLGGLGGADSRATPIPIINLNGAHNHHTHHGSLTNGNHSLNGIDTGNHKIRIKLQTPKSSVPRNKVDGAYIDGERQEPREWCRCNLGYLGIRLTSSSSNEEWHSKGSDLARGEDQKSFSQEAAGFNVLV